MGFLQRARDAVRVPQPAAGAIERGPGERLLSWACDGMSGAVVVAGSHRLYAVSSRGDVVLARPWHLVDTGTWDHDTSTLRVSWVDGEPAAQWRLPEPALLPETVRERVQASVVLAERVALGGGGQARAVIRQDFGTGRLVEQVVLGRGVAARDPAVTLATEAALARLREQVGMD